MPVTAKLSKHFYEQVGEQATNELVDWLNAVDQSYRADLRELNELNFARFDAKLEQRIAEVRAEINVGFAALGAKIVALDATIDRVAAEIEAKMERRFTEQNRWLIGMLLTMILGFFGLGVGMVGLWLRH